MRQTEPGTLLGGRVCHYQPVEGHRTGIEPILLAAAVPARAGEHVLEGGTGSGAALLCLYHRVPGLTGLGIDQDADLAAVARLNVTANAYAGITIATGDIATAPGRFDHAFANPPWHAPAGTASPDVKREAARRADAELPGRWSKALAQGLRHGGTITVVIAAHALPAWLAAIEAARCGSPKVLPLWPRPERAAKLVLLQAVRGGRSPFALLPGLILHAAAGGFTEAAQAVLRDGAALNLDARTSRTPPL